MSEVVPEISEESPESADAPAQVDTPVITDTPVPTTDAPLSDDAPITDEAPAPDDTPVPDEIPSSTDAPVSDEAPILDAESTPIDPVVSEDAPTDQLPITENSQTPNNADDIVEKEGDGESVEEDPSEQIETFPTLTDIREEVEPVAELITKSFENLDYEPEMIATSITNLSEDGDIPEIRPSTPEAADQDTDIEEAGWGPETDHLSELLEELKLLKEEEEKLSSDNSQLQHRLVEHFRSKRADERLGTAGEAERERGVTDYQQRYDKYLSVLQDRQSEAKKMREYSDQLLKSACETEKEMASELELVVKDESVFKQETMLAAVDSRTGKHMSSELMERLLREEAKKETEVSSIRLENIKLSRNLGKREEQLRQKEEVAEGLHKIEFEQLKIEHQKNNEKIEDRNEDISRLRGKITRTVQVLTHVKEKQYFVANENTAQREQLADSDIQVAELRDRLTYIKQNRDRLRGDSQRLQDRGGLVNHRKLLRDLEGKQDLSQELESRLKLLKRRHAELSQLSDGIKQKITQAKTSGSLSMIQVPH